MRNATPFAIVFGWLGAQPRYFAKSVVAGPHLSRHVSRRQGPQPPLASLRYCRYLELWGQGLGAEVVGVRPTILQTASPKAADAALSAFAATATEAYQRHCAAQGGLQPVFVQCMR